MTLTRTATSVDSESAATPEPRRAGSGNLSNAALPGPVVVGYDGSPVSDPVLQYAWSQALFQGVPLVVVAAYDITTPLWGIEFPEPAGSIDEVRGSEERTVRDAIGVVVERARPVGAADLQVEVVVRQGRPSEVLLDVAANASLIVVGGRGNGRWSRLVLGSTSTEVMHDAHVPVVMVPCPDLDRGPLLMADGSSTRGFAALLRNAQPGRSPAVPAAPR